MPFVPKEKVFSRSWFISYALIVAGAFILASGFVFFINPYNIVTGGVYGIGIIVHHLTAGLFSFWPNGIPIGLVGLALNIPLTLIGIKILGPRFGVKTVIGFFLASFFMDTLTMIVGENDPLGLSDEVFMSVIFGGVLIGFGLGLIFKSKATSGGSDIVAMIISKYTALPLGQLLIYIDS
ncbi:MAG: YitT family protein, partial [Lentimicrobiaceae bacterium]|nr:YitT family protein [Lentimicrobiaceae bacterium]